MKKLLLISILCGIISNVGAQSNVSGIITIDSVFSIDKSPYTVTSNLTVDEGIILTVDSGVVVEFNDGVSLEMNGTLNASKATFTSFKPVRTGCRPVMKAVRVGVQDGSVYMRWRVIPS